MTTKFISTSALVLALAGSGAMAEGITLTVWHNSGDPAAVLDLYKAYEAATGNTIALIDIPADQFPTATQIKWATGERPDLMEYMPTVQDMRQLNAHENMQDLSDMGFVAAEGALAEIAGTLDGKTYAAVLGPITTFAAFYNKEVYAAAGVPVPTNFGQLAETCEAIKALGKVPVHVGAGSEFPANMIAGFAYMADFNAELAFGRGVADGTIMVNDPNGPIVAGLTAVDNLRTAGCLNPDAATATFQDAVKAVYNGDAAMTVLPSDFIGQFYDLGGGDRAAVDAKIGLGAISAEKGIPSFSAGPYATFFAPKTGDAEKEAAAREFIEWVTTTGYQDYVNNAHSIPTMSNATAPDLSGLSADLANLLNHPDAVPAFNQMIPGFGSFGKSAVSVVIGQATPQEAADNWNVFVQQAIQAQKP